MDIRELKARIAASSAIVGFTGAGIATESGIPDYRDGLHQKPGVPDEKIVEGYFCPSPEKVCNSDTVHSFL